MSDEQEGSAMQVETDDFILSLTAGDDVDSNGQTEIVTTEVSDLPPDLVNTDVSELENNPSLWLGLEGALESHNAANMANVPAMNEEHVQMNESIAQMSDQHVLETLGHSEEVEMPMEAMEVDVQTSEVSRNEEISSIPMDNFMDQTDLGLEIMADSNSGKEETPQTLIPVTLSLPTTQTTTKVVLPQSQSRKITSVPTTSQVTKVVLAPAGQNQSGQPLLFTVPSSGSGFTSLLAPNTNIRFVNALGAGGTKVSSAGASSTGTSAQPMRLMSPTKTITLQQAQQLGLISPKKGQSLIVGKVSMASSSTTSTPSTILTTKATGAKFAGGNVTLVRSAPAKTPTKIAPAPPQTVVTTATASGQTQPTSLLIKNAAGQVTMATLVQARPNSVGVANLGSPQKFVLRPATPGSVTSTQTIRPGGTGTQPAQYIRLTTAQALAAGILPAVGGQGESSGQQQLQLGGNKIQLVRVVAPNSGGVTGSGNLVTSSGSPKVVISNSSAVKIAGSLVQQQSGKTILTSVSKAGVQVKSAPTASNTPQVGQRILLPAGSMGNLSNNLVMMPAQYVTLSSTTTSVTPTTSAQHSGSTNTTSLLSDAMPSPLVTSTPTPSTGRSAQQPKAAPPLSPESVHPSTPGSQSKTLNVLESNGLKPRKPCNCTKSQCLKLYCDCFANGEFCHGCNCVCCANNLEHEELRLRAIRSCLDRNPHAFKPKIGVGWGPEPRRHNKGCHCKRSGCLKNYCECYEAKIACSDMCKCIGCKNCVDPVPSPPGQGEKKSSKTAALLSHQNSSSEGRSASNPAAYNIKQEERSHEPAKSSTATSAPGVSRPPFSFITQEVVEATCQCLLAQAEEAERLCKTPVETEGLVLEEFGRCLLQIIEYASKAKVSASP